LDGIHIRDNRIIFYGNTAGYVDDENAIVDPIFQSEELKEYLTEKQNLKVQWINGVYDKLANGIPDATNNVTILKDCRIYQLKPDVDITMKFISYDEMQERFGKPNPENYSVAYDGQVETNELEMIYEKFNLSHPEGFHGHSLSMSDVVELYDQCGSTFYYCDRIGFRGTEFSPPSQELSDTQNMQL
jgi:hypothetical protein